MYGWFLGDSDACRSYLCILKHACGYGSKHLFPRKPTWLKENRSRPAVSRGFCLTHGHIFIYINNPKQNRKGKSSTTCKSFFILPLGTFLVPVCFRTQKNGMLFDVVTVVHAEWNGTSVHGRHYQQNAPGLLLT